MTKFELLKIRHSSDCSDACEANLSGVFAVRNNEGECQVVVTHDTDCYDSEGEFIGNGAFWQTLAVCNTADESDSIVREFRTINR